MILVFKKDGQQIARIESSKGPKEGDIIRLAPGGPEYEVEKIVTEFSAKFDHHIVEITVK